MNALNVFIVQSNSLLTLAMTSLLAGDSELNVIPSTARDAAGLIDEIGCQKADVVVIDENALCASSDFLAQLLSENPKLRVIMIHQNSNRLEIFHKEDVMLTSAADLVDVIYSV